MRILRLAAVAALLGGLALPGSPASAQEAGGLVHQHWSFDGLFGTYARAAAQRGFQVYKEVCAACHSLKHGHFRDLAGIGLSAADIKAIAAGETVPTIGDDGQPTTRPGLPSDQFPSPYPNEKAAIAALGIDPPDLSLIEKAREGGADYVYALLTGFTEAPANFKLAEGTYYNKAFPGHQIKMPKPLSDGQVTYADGTPSDVPQMSHDVVTFLAYMSNPELEERKRMGIKTVLFLVLLTGVVYAVKRKIWSNVEH
jgi:cytochrome c1